MDISLIYNLIWKLNIVRNGSTDLNTFRFKAQTIKSVKNIKKIFFFLVIWRNLKNSHLMCHYHQWLTILQIVRTMIF